MSRSIERIRLQAAPTSLAISGPGSVFTLHGASIRGGSIFKMVALLQAWNFRMARRF